MPQGSTPRSAYIPDTFIWDIEDIRLMEVTSVEFRELLVRMYQNMNRALLAINVREAGVYDLNEFICGQQFFSDKTRQPLVKRQVFRKVIDFGALPSSTTKSVAHNLTMTGGYKFTRLYGAASDTSAKNYLAIPNSAITLAVDSTNVKVTTTSNLSSYTTTFIILEYLKQ